MSEKMTIAVGDFPKDSTQQPPPDTVVVAPPPDSTVVQQPVDTVSMPADIRREFGVFPNPSNGEFSIEMNDEFIGAYSISIKDYSGLLVNRSEFKKDQSEFRTHFDMRTLPQGVYSLQIFRADGKKISRRLVIVQEVNTYPH
jgi:hypothetical protein